APADTATAWEIQLDDFRINNGNLVSYPIDTSSPIPREVRAVNARMSGEFRKDGQKLALHDLSLSTVHPDVQISSCSAAITMNRSGIALTSFVLKSAVNSIEARGFISREGPQHGTLSLRTSPLELSEFAEVLPGIPAGIRPVVTADVNL